MKAELKDQIGKAIYHAIKAGKGLEALALSERIMGSVELIYDINHEDAGIGPVPPGWDMRTNDFEKPGRETYIPRPPAAPGAGVPVERAPAERRLVAMPGEPEFNQTKDGGELPKITLGQIRRPTRPGVAPKPVQYWSEGDLIQAIREGTPEHIIVDTHNREGQPRRIQLVRNIMNKQGLGSVDLTYKAPQIADSDQFLTVIHPFSLFVAEHDMGAAMKQIQENARGQYAPRNPSMDPRSGPEPGGLTLDMRNQPGDTAEIRLNSGEAFVENPAEAAVRSHNAVPADRSIIMPPRGPRE